jgi:hypothetical protein
VVIIIDHLRRWPSFLEIFTGRGILWVNAAFGFVIISGLLIGYVRGYKNRLERFTTVTKKLLKRSLLLYIWLVIGTILYASITWYMHNKNLLAWVEIPVGDWQSLALSAVTFNYTNNWVHFLELYALFLFVSPVALYFLRKHLGWIVILLSLATYVVGLLTSIEWLQWQILFFVPSVAGFYLEHIIQFWKNQNRVRKVTIGWLLFSVILLTLSVSIVTSIILPENSVSIAINTAFFHTPLSLLAVILSFCYFIALILLFNRFTSVISKCLGWLLYPLGTRSLTAYIVHPTTIILCALIFSGSQSIVLNTLLGLVCIIGTWMLTKQKFIQKIVPR